MAIDLHAVVPAGDVLLVVPPFASIDRPSYGLHLLKALAEREGFRAEVLYANILFAREIGEELYTAICYGSTGQLNGEKVFARAAFGARYARGAIPRPPPRRRPDKATDTMEAPADLDARAIDWTDALAAAIARLDYPVVGCNVMFEQTTATIALCRRLKQIKPAAVLIAGGALCEGPMAQGLASLTDSIDHLFSGESERTFIEFLRARRDGARAGRIITGEPCVDLDALPQVDYTSYFAQLQGFLPDSAILKENLIWLPYEGSRGCWWGQKHHCTFCGINGTGMAFRQKSADRVCRDLADFKKRYAAHNVLMLDNIMPHKYFQDLLPMLKERRLGFNIFYEQKANLTFRRMRALREAGVALIQPGIEALSDNMLRLMKKGVQVRQNVAALRFARSLDVSVTWNLLYGFPGDGEADYRATTALIPLLEHLCPPTGISHLSIDRFSPYHDTPQAYGITAVRPMQAYFEVFPAHADLQNIAYHFEGDYETAARRDAKLVAAMDRAVERWQKYWDGDGALPTLAVRKLGEDAYVIADTRKCATKEFYLVNRRHAMATLVEQPVTDAAAKWAIKHLLAVKIGDTAVPLAVADREFFADIFDATAERQQTTLAA
jgi:ribosomal peptide maturation radical SAM protein 1